MSGDEVVVTTVEDGGTLVVRLNRPAVHNALNGEVFAHLSALLDRVAEDEGIRAVVLTGSGENSFCAGADLAELDGLGPDAAHQLMARGQRVFRRLETLPVPVIAAVNGIALGGGFELVLACSLSVIAERASLGLPETGLGLVPGYGGTQRLPRIVGAPVARHIMLTGARLSAVRAYELGLTPLPPAPATQVLPTALGLAREIAARGPRAIRSVLGLVDRGTDGPLDEGLALETEAAARAVSGTESSEGVAAFLAKRTPRFEGSAR